MKYRTIIADPPWPQPSGGPDRRAATHGVPSALPYPTLPLAEIKALPVAEWADADAHLYLWTTNHHLESAYAVARSWGFAPSTLLTWCKVPKGIGLGGTFSVSSEFVLFARRGSLPALRRVETTWFQWPRGPHSTKPDAFMDLIESVSPGPYLELFARRNRLGWDTWGNEALNHIKVAGAAGQEGTSRG